MIYVVGIGPGGLDEITPRALEAIRSCDVIAGYRPYVEMLGDERIGKILYTSLMGSEVERCRMCLKFAVDYGKSVALVSSGDAGVYGMAGVMIEVARGSGQEVKVIAGITAANSCAAVLGAPLMNDYAVVSLSDLLTGWGTIEKRLVAACIGDYVVCMYNPMSSRRPYNLKRACEILLRHKDGSTPAGYVKNAGRNDESHEVMTLKEMKNKELDMFCTVIVGNSQSYIHDGLIITPRGYDLSL